ncbi:MAG: magnesium transporter, partial [Dehalococcoidia bacterium]
METLNQKAFEELIESRNLKTLRVRLMGMEALDIAILLESVSEEEMALAFRLLPKDLAVEVFDDFDGPTQHRLLESLTHRVVSQLLEAMSPDDRTELLEEVPASVTRRLLGLLSPEQRQVTLQLLGYEENSAGREMTPYFVDLRSNMTVAQAMERIRKLAVDRETIYECYVIDPQRHLTGTVSLKELVLARLESSVADVTQPNPRRVFTHSDREEAAS